MDYFWRPMRWAVIFALLTWGMSGCEVEGFEPDPALDLSSETEQLGLKGLPAEASSDRSEAGLPVSLPEPGPCDEVTQSKMKLIEANSQWSFGTMDPAHPDYCDIIEGAYDLLLDYLDTDPDMVKEPILFRIKNEKRIYKGVSIAAFTEPSGPGHIITFYNPQAP